MRQMRDQGVKAPLMGGDGITSDEFASIGGPGVEGTLMTYGPDPRKQAGAPKRGRRNSAPRISSRKPTRSTATPRVQIIKQAAEAAKSLDPKKVAEKMHSGMQVQDRDRRSQPTTRRATSRKLDYVMYVWKKDASGKITYVECPGSDCSKVK